jgi:hypothetical protein
MENTPRLTAEPEDTRTNRLVERLLADRHSLPLSIALHLVPGALIVAVYAFIGAPFTRVIGYPPFLAWAIALTVVLYPVLFGLLTPTRAGDRTPAACVPGGPRAPAGGCGTRLAG